MRLGDPIQELRQRVATACAAAFPGLPPVADAMVTPSRVPELADYQCNLAMSLAKTLGRKPADIARSIVEKLEVADFAEPPTIAGPGFINVKLRADALGAALAGLDTPRLGIEPTGAPETIVIDLGGVNLAKLMHVGHLRSTVIPDAAARALERLGHRVVRQSHVGDWGVNIAMVTGKLMEESAAGREHRALDLDELERLYKAANRECERDLAGLDAARRYALGPKVLAELEEQVAGASEAYRRAQETLVRLQAGDAATRAVWERIYAVTMRECLATCARLYADITDEHTAGESSYADELGPLVDDCIARGVAEESDGAIVIRVPGHEVPCIIRKRDGGFLYATTDLAAIRRRVRTIGASRVAYFVDARQSLHFSLVFGAARRAGYATTLDGRAASLEHAAFGTILGDDGRPFKTRSGESVKLASLLDEASARAFEAVSTRSPDLPAEERRAIAEVVGIAAIKYADLSNDRVKDYVFDFDRMLAFEGNTGPYLLYALVRVRSIFRKAAERGISGFAEARFSVQHPAEKGLALALLKYPAAVRGVADALEPHRLCGYLFELASAFSTFFDACPVLAAEDPAARDGRLRLCDLTAKILADGLGVLGIPALDRM